MKNKKKIPILQMIITFVDKKQYGKALITLIADIIGCIYIIALLCGVVVDVLDGSFEISSYIYSMIAITCSVMTIYLLYTFQE